MSVEIRSYVPSDFEAVQRIHIQGGLDYQLPDLESQLFVVRKVLTVDGKVVCALLYRVEVETYLLLDTENNLEPEAKLLAIKVLQEECLKELQVRGIDCCVAYVPEKIEKHFSKRLLQLGWSKNREGWYTWSRSVS